MVNRVIKSTAIKTIVNNGQPVNLKYATETETWRRPFLSPEMQEKFAQAMEKAYIPAGATTAIMTETEHPSKKDAYPHFTTVYENDNGEHVTVKHVDP